ncbi:MauE/DoxX family redox-associated membrane protein [Lysinibacillus xylanilyticus]|uniref:MauE/DoxX family redox-associated membrane protein n=1 Tax=Lysinibacillus xylanilyticus TaxID=582475 RepID=UPI0037F3559B
MEIYILVIRNIFALIFLTSSISKIKNYEDHVFSIIEYKIIPTKYVRKYAVIDITLEILLGLAFLIGMYIKYAFVGSTLILAIYTIVISINVIKGRTDIDCGCGGIVGAHKLSWMLVYRNLILIIVLVVSLLMINIATEIQYFSIEALLFKSASFKEVFTYSGLLTIIVTTILIYALLIVINLNKIRSIFKLLLKSLLKEKGDKIVGN